MARKEKVAESTSSLESQPAERPEFESGSPSVEASGEIELVDETGPIKRIVFEGTEPPSPPAPEPVASEVREADIPPMPSEYRMAVPGAGGQLHERSESIHSIREEVDRLNAPDPSFAGAPPRANLRAWRTTTVYRTEQGGEVRAHEGPTGKTYTLSDGVQERRFTETEVDRAIAEVDQRSRSAAAVTESASEEVVEAKEEKKAKKRRGLFGFGRKGKEEAVEEAPITEGAAADEYQPQCSALTEEGMQCRNSARGGSKYCSSHFGYQPRTTQGILAAKDTDPRYESSVDTVPGGGWDPGNQAGAQCSAITKGGKQCQNPIMAGSPYCGNHQDYSEPGPRAIVESVDTKPRWSKAKDTKPATRKAPKGASKGSKGKR